MGSNFFTNEEENTLKNKINNILQIDKNIEYLDFLIGYFRITGFNKISDNLSNIEHTRILVGINADKNSFDATQLIKKFSKESLSIGKEILKQERKVNIVYNDKKIIKNLLAIKFIKDAK